MLKARRVLWAVSRVPYSGSITALRGRRDTEIRIVRSVNNPDLKGRASASITDELRGKVWVTRIRIQSRFRIGIGIGSESGLADRNQFAA